MTVVNACRDCHWYKRRWFRQDQCLHPNVQPMSADYDYLSGRMVRDERPPIPAVARMNIGECRPAGLLWEPK